jgi:hypothetical protein
VDLFDRLALASRKFERRRSAVTGSVQLPLDEVLLAFHGKTILEMDIRPAGRGPARFLHERGRPVSLIDGVAEIGGGNNGWYEVMQTAPSGDYTKVRITAHPGGGLLSMLVGRRTPEHHFAEDALFDTLRSRGTEV